jgi:hypothetical protein
MSPLGGTTSTLGSHFASWGEIKNRPVVQKGVTFHTLQFCAPPGTDVMIFKIFSRKNWQFLTQTKLNYAKVGSYVRNIGLLEKCHFFAENCQKSQSTVIITSTPDILQNMPFLFRKALTNWQQMSRRTRGYC